MRGVLSVWVLGRN